MNTYAKYIPNVFLAKCDEKHEKGEVIPVTTRHGKENDSIVFNLILEKDGFYYYSIVREDGFNVQEWAKKRAEKLENAASNAAKKSDQYWKASDEGKEFLSLGEPIKIGHHSEKRHRALIERNFDRMEKSHEYQKKADDYEIRVQYWAARANTINLSMPESIEFYEFEYENAKKLHEGLKDGTIKKSHSYSLTYAKKDLNEADRKVKIAKTLWG